MKNLNLLCVVIFAFLAVSCGEDKSNKPNSKPSVPHPGGQQGQMDQGPQAFFSALQAQEDLLYSNYTFRILKLYPHIKYEFPNRERLLYFAQRKGVSLSQIKRQYFDDLYYFSLNHINLEQRKRELEAYNSELYHSFYRKTFYLHQEFAPKRSAFYSRLKSRLNADLEAMGLSSLEILNTPEQKISVPSIDRSAFYTTPLEKIKSTLNEAIEICSSLAALSVDSTDVSVCQSGEAAHQVFIMDLISQNRSPFRHQDLINEVSNYSYSKVMDLNSVANEFLLENAIQLNASFPRGFDTHQRGSWERAFISSHMSHSPMDIEQALQNNLYENLIFKRKTVQALLSLELSPNDRSLHQSVLSLIDQALAPIVYKPGHILRAGSSPQDGFLYDY